MVFTYIYIYCIYITPYTNYNRHGLYMTSSLQMSRVFFLVDMLTPFCSLSNVTVKIVLIVAWEALADPLPFWW